MISSNLFFGVLVLLIGVSLKGMFSSGMSVSSPEEVPKGGLDVFRAMVEDLDLTQKYMKDDAFLLRYLTAKDFNLKEAYDLLRRVLEIRKSEKLDSILEEDWSEHEKRFPYSISSVNKEGRPVLFIPYGKWDISQEMGTGDFEKFSRYAGYKMLEESDRKVHSMREQEQNNDISQFDVIVNLDGYTLEKHGCFQCLQAYMEIMRQVETPFRNANKKSFYINTPAVFQAIYPLLSNIFADEKTRQKSEMLGGRSSYEPVLLQHIDADQLPNDILSQED